MVHKTSVQIQWKRSYSPVDDRIITRVTDNLHLRLTWWKRHVSSWKFTLCTRGSHCSPYTLGERLLWDVAYKIYYLSLQQPDEVASYWLSAAKSFRNSYKIQIDVPFLCMDDNWSNCKCEGWNDDALRAWSDVRRGCCCHRRFKLLAWIITLTTYDLVGCLVARRCWAQAKKFPTQTWQCSYRFDR